MGKKALSVLVAVVALVSSAVPALAAAGSKAIIPDCSRIVDGTLICDAEFVFRDSLYPDQRTFIAEWNNASGHRAVFDSRNDSTSASFIHFVIFDQPVTVNDLVSYLPNGSAQPGFGSPVPCRYIYARVDKGRNKAEFLTEVLNRSAGERISTIGTIIFCDLYWEDVLDPYDLGTHGFVADIAGGGGGEEPSSSVPDPPPTPPPVIDLPDFVPPSVNSEYLLFDTATLTNMVNQIKDAIAPIGRVAFVIFAGIAGICLLIGLVLYFMRL